MKRILLLSILLVLFNCNRSEEKDVSIDAQIDEQLLGKWQLTEVSYITDYSSLEVVYFDDGAIMDFNDDLTFSFSSYDEFIGDYFYQGDYQVITEQMGEDNPGELILNRENGPVHYTYFIHNENLYLFPHLENVQYDSNTYNKYIKLKDE